MPAPHRLQIGTEYSDTIPFINDNFENVVQDIRDLGANLSTIRTQTLAVGAGQLVAATWTLTSQGVTSMSVNQVFTIKPTSSVTGISPFLDIYVDTDNDANFLFPTGASLTGGLLKLFVGLSISNSGYANSLGAWVIQVNNRDTASHTYYIHTRCGYLPTGIQGQYR